MRRCVDVILRACEIVGLAAVMSSAAMAQPKTAKQCRDEWRANEAAFKAKGVTESAYVKECRDEWRANEAANKKAGITESAYVKDCRAGTTTAQPASPPAVAPAAAPAP